MLLNVADVENKTVEVLSGELSKYASQFKVIEPI